MTRERYIKLLMSRGIQRNQAEQQAVSTLSTFGYYPDPNDVTFHLQLACRKLSISIQKATNSFKTLCNVCKLYDN